MSELSDELNEYTNEHIINILNTSINKINRLNESFDETTKINMLNEEQAVKFCDIFKETFKFIVDFNKTIPFNILRFDSAKNIFVITVASDIVNEGEEYNFFNRVPNYEIKMKPDQFIKLILDSILFYIIKFNKNKYKPTWVNDLNNNSVLVDDFILQRYYSILIPIMINYILGIPGMAAKLNELATLIDTTNFQTDTSQKGGKFTNKNKVKKTLKKNIKKRKYNKSSFRKIKRRKHNNSRKS